MYRAGTLRRTFRLPAIQKTCRGACLAERSHSDQTGDKNTWAAMGRAVGSEAARPAPHVLCGSGAAPHDGTDRPWLRSGPNSTRTSQHATSDLQIKQVGARNEQAADEAMSGICYQHKVARVHVRLWRIFRFLFDGCCQLLPPSAAAARRFRGTTPLRPAAVRVPLNTSTVPTISWLSRCIKRGMWILLTPSKLSASTPICSAMVRTVSPRVAVA